MPKPNLEACYSMTGNPRSGTDEVTIALEADDEKFREPDPRRGLVGVLRTLFDAITRRQPPSESIRRDPSDCELPALSDPVRAGRLAPRCGAMRNSLLQRQAESHLVYRRWPRWGACVCRTEQPV